MSMKEYGVSEFGMIIDADLEKKICEKFKADGLYDIEAGVIASFSEFSGVIRCIAENGDIYGHGENFYDETIYFFPTEFAPNFIKASYSSIDKIAKEIALIAKDYLPEGYPVKDHLCFIYGTIFG